MWIDENNTATARRGATVMGARRLCGAEQVAAADALPPSPSHDWRLNTKQPAQPTSAALSILDLGYFFERAIILRRKVLKKSTETHDILPERKKLHV